MSQAKKDAAEALEERSTCSARNARIARKVLI